MNFGLFARIRSKKASTSVGSHSHGYWLEKVPVPSLVISELLGVPYEDHEFFQHHATIGLDRYATAEQTAKGAAELATYLARLVDAKLGDPAEDVVSDLAQQVKAGEMTMEEAAVIGTSLLIAGHETSANMIALGALAVLAHPDQFAALRDAEDQKVVANAVEEMLRYLSIVQNGQRRIAIDDIEIGGEVIGAGEGIILDFPAGNWDSEVFPEPERLDLHRAAPPTSGIRIWPARMRWPTACPRRAPGALRHAVPSHAHTAPGHLQPHRIQE